MAQLNGEYDDDNNDDEAAPLVTAVTIPTNNEIRSTVSSSFQIKRTKEENDFTIGMEQNATKSKAMSKQQQSRLRYILICVIVSMIVLFYSKRNNTTSIVDENQITPVTTSSSKFHYATDSSKIVKPKMTLQSLRMLQKNVIQAHEKFTQQLQEQYGEYYEDIFFISGGKSKKENRTRVSRGSLLFESGNAESNLSKERFQRKLMMKLLEASAFTYPKEVTTANTNTTFSRDTKFVWATGGHSATAGHGNFYNESYTAYIQYALEGIFRSVNIELITRKYAMGGTSAGSELALCTKEIYGTDFDVLVWDFGMTDGGNYWKQAWYNYRANLLPFQNPIHIAYHAGSRNSARYNIADTFEQMGMASIISNDDIMREAENAIPDSLGMTDEEINGLPEYVRNYKCGNEIEAGDPYCKSDKFRLGQCPKRKFQASWHPGWKWHALMGYLASFYVIDVLYSAVDELATQLITIDAAAIYKTLQEQAYQDYDTFRQAKMPESINIFSGFSETDFNSTYIIGGPNYCHTTKLPSEIRFLGILTETATQIGPNDYDKGLGVQTLLKKGYKSNDKTNPNGSGAQSMILSYDEADRQICPIRTNEDYKDFYFVGANTGWQQLTLPNHSERNAYSIREGSFSSTSTIPLLQGYVAMCLTLCPWDKCPKGVWSRNVYTESNYLEIRINQVMVTNYTNIGNSECDLLRHNDGYRFPIDDKDNTVAIEVQLNVPDTKNPRSYIRISSWIVW